MAQFVYSPRRRMLSAAAIVTSLITSTAYAEGSIRDSLKAGVTNGVNSSLPGDCIEVIRQRLNRGTAFRSAKLDDLVQAIATAPLGDLTMFHYTTYEGFRDVATRADLNAIFTHLRRAGRSASGWNLYLAADSVSAEGYGHIQVEIGLNSRALVFNPLRELRPSVKPNQEERVDEALIEARRIETLIERELFVSASLPPSCHFDIQHLEDVSPVILLALEERGVSLIAYYGLNQGLTIDRGGTPYLWLQLLGTDDVIRLKASSRVTQ